MSKYSADIEIAVRGGQQLNDAIKTLNRLNNSVNVVNRNAKLLKGKGFNVASIENYSRAVSKAERAVRKAAEGTDQERQAITRLVSAMELENKARERKNILIAREVANQRRVVATANAGVGMQGPELPAYFNQGPSSPIGGRKFIPGSPAALSGGGGGGGGGASNKGSLGFNPNATAENLALGAGFPLLFGGGAGQVAGGLLGSFFGAGFGGQILGSAIGQQLEDALRRISEIGRSLETLNMETLRASVIIVNRDLDYQAQKLIEIGKYEQARAAITKQVVLQTGAVGSAVEDAASTTRLLQNAWDGFVAPVSALLSALAGPFVAALAAALKLVGLAVTGVNVLVTGFGALIKGAAEWVLRLAGGEQLLARVQNLFKGVNEEDEKANAAARLQTDELDRQIRLNTELFAIEKNRLEGSNRAAQTSQALAEKDATYATIKKDLETEIRKIYTDNKDVSQDTLNLLIGQTEALAQQKRNSADLAASRRLQKIDNDAILASLQAQADVLAFETQQTQAVSSARAQFLQLDQARLQKQQELTTSLNQEAGLINQLAQLRIQAATEEYQSSVLSLQAAVERAQAEYNIVNAKYAQNNANLEEVDAAGRKVALAQQALALESGVAAARLEQVRFTEEISRRQALVNAYAQEYERINTRTLQVLQQQTSALDNQAKLASAVSQAAQTINNIEIQSLERDLQRVTSTRERADIIKRIYDLEVDNARVVLLATRAQIRADLARADIAFRTVQLEFRKLQAVVALARAQGVLNQGHIDALNAQRSALIIAADTLKVSKQVAGVQLQAADAVYKAAVNAARLRSEMLSAAGAAQSFAGAASTGAMAAGAGAAALGQTRVLSKQTDPTKPGYYAETILPDGRRRTTRTFVVYDPRTANRIRPLTQNPLANTLNAPPPEVTPDRYVIPQQPPTTGAASVNITTGPVLQQDGQRYVTLGDLESAMQQVVGTVLNNGRTSGGRRYAGIR